MNMNSDIHSNCDMEDLQHALRSVKSELNLERNKHLIEVIAEQEETRKLRVSQCILQDDNRDLREHLQEEQACSEELRRVLEEYLVQIDEQRAHGELTQNQARLQTREVANLKAELKAMENVTANSNKILSEKLALSREISTLRPEVEHLRAQEASNQGLLAEKLALQRQLATLQIELENEKRTLARTIAKQERKVEQDETFRRELEEVRSELAKEKEERSKTGAMLAKAEKAIKQDNDDRHKLDNALDELAEEKKGRLEAEAALAKAEKANGEMQTKLKSQQSSIDYFQGRVNPVSEHEASEEKCEWQRQQEESALTLAKLQGQNAVLDERMVALGETLRSTKEKLRQTEAELKKKASQAHTKSSTRAMTLNEVKPAAKNTRKRVATTEEPETNLGTPGNGFLVKKTKRSTSTSAVGDTSAFSLTPFLNRASSVAPVSLSDEEENMDMEADQSEAIPCTLLKNTSKKSRQPKAKPLAVAAPTKTNAKSHKKTVIAVLEKVNEECSESSKNEFGGLGKEAENEPSTMTGTHLPKSRPRKSLMSFATFTEEPAIEKKKKKRRRLGAGADGEADRMLLDDGVSRDDVSTRPAFASKGLLVARALGKRGQQRPISGGLGMLSEEGFTFSPLKKDRRGASMIA